MSKKRAKRTGAGKAAEHLKARVQALSKRLRAMKAQALLLTNPADIRYLSGFVGEDSWALIRAGSSIPHILSDFRFEEQIAREAPHARLILRKRSLADELKTLVDRFNLERIAVQPASMTLAQRKLIAKKIGAGRLMDADDGLLSQRAVKDASELAAIRKALRIQQKAFEQTLAQIEPGWKEREVAALLEYQMRINGAEGRSFPTIVAADANASLPHAIPGQKRLRRNGLLLIDWGARADGYCADMTRTLAIGRMSAKMREVYQIVLEAQQAAIDVIAPGKPMVQVDAAAREVIRKAGYGDRFGHGLGHGLGMDVHELPSLSPRSEGELQPGHVVTVEPGIYLPGVGGVRIEDDVLVTERGAKNLSRLPKSLESARI